MVRVRVLKKEDRSYILLPDGLKSLEEVEVFHLRDGYYMLSAPLDEKAEKRKPGEKEVLLKLLSVKFGNRTPAYIEKVFSPEEKQVLRILEKKKMVNVFKSKKYRNGVYNVNDKAYLLVRGKRQASGKKPDAPLDVLKKGFAVIKNKNDARKFAGQLSSEMRKGAVKGMKGFDGNFYLATSSYYKKASPLITKVLDRPLSAEKIADAAGLEEDGCIAVLMMMSENGEVIEKKRGVFALVEG